MTLVNGAVTFGWLQVRLDRQVSKALPARRPEQPVLPEVPERREFAVQTELEARRAPTPE